MEKDNRSRRGAFPGDDYVSVEIKPEDEDLALSIKEKMETLSISRCICRVPREVSHNNEENYFPELVSIGPFHHGETKLMATEDQKWRYLNALLGRKPILIEAILGSCVNALKELEPKVRIFYREKIDLDSNELVKMMLLDGCFIIELLIKYSVKSLRRRDDSFFNKKGAFSRLRRDIILLENQVPFFLLQRLFHLVPLPKQCSQSLTELVLSFFRRMIPFSGDIQILQGNVSQDFNHLLDLIRNYYLPTYPEDPSLRGMRNLHYATEIQEAGIGFKAAAAESLLDIKFARGVFEIPPLKVHDYTEIVFRNLVALEHCDSDCPKQITSYVFLMGKLIQSKNDVRLLYRTRILTNGLERMEEILDLFKKLHVELDVKDFCYRGVCEQVNGYKRGTWRVWFRKMQQRYHITPMAAIGLVLAILLLVLTFIGALFSVLAFTLHHHF